MDVTAMLNSGAAAMARANAQGSQSPERRAREEDSSMASMSLSTPLAENKMTSSTKESTPLSSVDEGQAKNDRMSDSPNPSRSRRPWDGNGFSLSQALDAKKRMSSGGPGAGGPGGASASSGSDSCSPEAAPIAMDMSWSSTSPKSSLSPSHKFSDSHSSFCSSLHTATSSTNSVSHSRLSSLSEVSERPSQHLSSLITDFSHLETTAIGRSCSSEHLSATSTGCPPLPLLSQLPQMPQVSQMAAQQKQQAPNGVRSLGFAQPGAVQTSLGRRNGMLSEEAEFSLDSLTPVRSRHELPPYHGSPERSPRSLHRAQSPSDAILMMKTSGSSEVNPFPRLNVPTIHSRSSSRSSTKSAETLPSIRRHKRAVSAPDFCVAASTFNPRFPTFGPIPEPTPSPSQHSDMNAMEQDLPPMLGSGVLSTVATPETAVRHRMPVSGSMETPASHERRPSSGGSMMGTSPRGSSPVPATRAPLPVSAATAATAAAAAHTAAQAATPAEEPQANFDTASACMYRGDCQTGSQLRKAISHIFGRNKLCTRMIPTGVWVHYCRKHYQRTRYRNGGEYPQRQIGLVQVQVKRVQAWSDSNLRQGRGPILKDWSLAVRKREQMRLDSKMAAAVTGRKRPYQDDGVGDDEDDGGYGGGGGGGGSVGGEADLRAGDLSGTAVPDWVVARIGDGYSTVEILDVVERLRVDIDEGRLQQIPDIEILPNIATDINAHDDSTSTTKKNSFASKRRATNTSRGSNSMHPAFNGMSSSGMSGMGGMSGLSAMGGMGGLGVGGVGHRRSQSVNTGMGYDSPMAMGRRRSQSNVGGFLSSPYNRGAVPPLPPRMMHNDMHYHGPMEKRQRMDGERFERFERSDHYDRFDRLERSDRFERFERHDRYERPSNGGSGPGDTAGYGDSFESLEALSNGHARPSLGGRMQLAHRPAFGEIRENHAEGGHSSGHSGGSGGRPEYYDYQQPPSHPGYHGSPLQQPHQHQHQPPTSGYGLLPAPNVTRNGSLSSGSGPQNAGTSSYALSMAASRRTNAHQRSQSDALFYHSHMPTLSGSSSASSISPSSMHQQRPTSSSSGFPPMTSSTSPSGSATGVNGSYPAGADRKTHGPQMPQMPQLPQLPAYGGGESNDRFDNVQLPPLQSLAPMHSHNQAKHARHQSSPVMSRFPPTPMEVGHMSESFARPPSSST